MFRPPYLESWGLGRSEDLIGFRGLGFRVFGGTPNPKSL